MRVQFSVVGRLQPFGVTYVDLDVIPREGDSVMLPGLEDRLGNVRHVSWYPLGDPDTNDLDPFVYVVLGPTRRD